MLEWTSQAVRAYEREVAEQEEKRKQRHKNLALAVSLLVGHILDAQSDTFRLYYTQHRDALTFVFIDEHSSALALVDRCPFCRQEYQYPVLNRAALGRRLVEGPPPHVGCPNEPATRV